MKRREDREAWRQRVERWRRSGLDAQSFAAREGVRADTLRWWRWQLAKGRPSAEASRPTRSASRAIVPTDFVELIPATRPAIGGDGACGLEVELVAGYRVRLARDFSADALARLLDVLEARP